MERLFGGVVVGLVLFAVVFGMRSCNKGKVESQCHTAAYALVAKCDKYRDHSGYIIEICDAAHEEAFSHAYKMGYGRRDRSTMDYGIYYTELFDLMAQRASSDNRKDIAESLDKLLADVNAGKVQIDQPDL